jgi:uncharacterized protein
MVLPLFVACSSPAPQAPPTEAAPTASPTAARSVASPVPSPAASANSTDSSAGKSSDATVTRNVDALAYTHDDKGHPQGVISPVTLSVHSGARSDEFRLGFFETDVNQMGPMWRASGWMASAVGALETGQDPNTLQVSWKTTGFVDGPSAGGLMTATFISALQNDEVKKDVAFTGTINPDGSIGPVGGIQYKLEAAAKQGKKLMLIPIGQRYDIDEETKQGVDVIQKGQVLGVKVQEIATIDDAYEALTGKTLPRVQTSSRTPDLSPEAYDRMKPKVLDWQAEYKDAMGRFKSSSAQAQDIFEDEAADAEAQARAAEKALSQGSVAEAYQDIQQATVSANTLALGARAVEVLLRTNDFAAARNALVQSAGASRVDPLMERLRTLQASSPEEAILAVEASSNALTAVALDDAVSREIDAAKAARTQTDSFQHLFMAAAFQSAQKYAAKAAEDALTFNVGQKSTGKRVDPRALEDWAGVFQRAAQANLSYFDAIVLDQAAQAAGIRTEEAKARFQAASFPYQIAQFGASPGAQQYLEKTMGKGVATNYAHLGFAVASYLSSSELVAEHYSLGAQTDDDGNITGFARDRALSAMLDAASDRARERIAAVSKAGGDPSLAILAYQGGHAAREGGPTEKLDALRSYWTASTYARLLTLMAQ